MAPYGYAGARIGLWSVAGDIAGGYADGVWCGVIASNYLVMYSSYVVSCKASGIYAV